MDIAIISINAIGDTYLSLSAIKPLREYFGDSCCIHLFSRADCQKLAELTGVEKFYPLRNKDFFNIIKLLWKMRSIRFDYVFSFFPGKVNSIFFLLSRKKYYAGFYNFKTKKQWWLNSYEKGIAKKNIFKNYTWDSSEPYLQRISKSLEAVEIPCKDVKKPMFNLSLKERKTSEQYVLLHLHSSQKERSLNPESILKIIWFLYQRYCCKIKIMVWGADINFLKPIVSPMNFVDLIENSSLDNTTVLIFYAKIFLGIESFPIHIADAYDSNFIGIFGLSNPRTALQHYHKSIEFSANNLIDVDSERLINALASVLT